MALVISPSAKHDITRRSLITPAQLEAFGSQLLSCCLDNKELFELSTVCVNFDNQTQKYDTCDFLNTIDGLVYGGMLEFQKCWIEGNPWPKTRAEWLQALLPHFTLLFASNKDFPEVLKTEAIQKIVCLPPAYPGAYDLVCDGLIDYITGVRYFQLEAKTKHLDPSAKRQALEEVTLRIRIPSARVELQDNAAILDSIFGQLQPTKPFFTGVRTFDHYYGSRAYGGDAWLFFGHPGGGKTNLACQTTGYTAAAGKLVLYFTTEVKTATLLQRACSAQSGIPYNLLKALRGNREHPQAGTFTNWINTIGRNIVVIDYREIQGKDYREKFKRGLEAFYRKHGRHPDLIVWDWIGKALDAGYADAWQKREAYNGVAGMMVDAADEMDNATITLAQASKESKNRTNLTEQDTADSKSLSDGMEGACGITSLTDTTERNAGSQECHREQQYLVICKCREEQALRIAVKRAFDVARFESVM